MINFNNYNGQKETENAVREIAYAELMEFLIMKHGEDNVSMTEKGIAVAYGTKTLSDGTEGEVCVTIPVKTENYDDRITPNGRIISAYQRLAMADDYEFKKMAKEEKEVEKMKAKEEKKRLLAQAKADKLRAKLAMIENSIK